MNNKAGDLIKIKRIYDPPDPKDGIRILVDRLWPRGVKKENAKVDIWMKEIAPSPGLRKWFNHEPAKWEDFKKAYKEELEHSKVIGELGEYIRVNKKITLLYAASDQEHNHALVLLDYIKKVFRPGKK
ncbi:DUF488 domain-containing protein [Terrimonas pollutisoli]|uniref:DUF488 domain-containing protein n=1 Tax=Terrimonas pollutisoli TaxID=3034147 RepID=UPI0023EDE828|nr:DUF488 domain-containing protein [Terrimonas sp. H1YJ31]